MFDKAIIENGGTLEYVPDCYKNQHRCDKAFDIYPLVLKFVLDCYITKNICDKAANIYQPTIQFFPEYYETQ